MAKNSVVDNKDARQMIIDAVAPKLRADELTVSVRGPFLTSVMMQDGNYKQKPIQPDVELLFKGMREGQRSAFIFEFEPVGATEFKQVEFEERKIFEAMPDFEQTLVNALGFYDEGLSWAKAKNKFVSERRAELAAEKEIAKEEEKARYIEDPEWGMF